MLGGDGLVWVLAQDLVHLLLQASLGLGVARQQVQDEADGVGRLKGRWKLPQVEGFCSSWAQWLITWLGLLDVSR